MSDETLPCEVRTYCDTDHDLCRSLWAELTQRHREIYGDPTIGGVDAGAGFDAYLADPIRRATWVGEVRGVVVGMAGLLVRGEEAEVEPVVVLPGYRSRGVGGALVRHAVRVAENCGARFLSVRPVARNVEAISFFVGCGFDLLGHVELFQDLRPIRQAQGLRPIRQAQGLRPLRQAQGLRPLRKAQGLRPLRKAQGLRPLRQAQGRAWQRGVSLHGNPLRY